MNKTGELILMGERKEGCQFVGPKCTTGYTSERSTGTKVQDLYWAWSRVTNIEDFKTSDRVEHLSVWVGGVTFEVSPQIR